MRSKLLFAAAVLAMVLLGCQKDVFQVFFHTSSNFRFAESTSGNVWTPAGITVPANFNFAVLGDIHTMPDGTSLVPQMTTDFQGRNISFFAVLGDLTDDGTTAEMNFAKTALGSVGVPYYTTLGNHDLFQTGDRGGWEVWKTTFGAATYSVTINNVVRLIFLDTGSGEIGDLQFDWLQQQLNTSVPFTFVCSHYGISDGLTPHMWRLESVDERYKLSSMLNGAGVYAFVGGHLHAFSHGKVGNVEHFLVGNMHPADLDDGKHGYTLFSYAAGAMTWKTITLD